MTFIFLLPETFGELFYSPYRGNMYIIYIYIFLKRVCVLESRGIMTLKRDGLGLFLLANGSDSFGRSVVKEIKLCSAAPDVGQYHCEVSPLAATWFEPSQLRLILFWGHYADGRKSRWRINLRLKGSLYVFSPQRHHYQFLFLLALYVKSTLGVPYITFPASSFFSAHFPMK